MLQRVMSQFSVEVFCLTVPNHFVEEPFCAVFQKFSGREEVYGKEGGVGVSIFSVEYFLSQSAEKFRRGNSVCLCFRVSKKFMLLRVMSQFSVEFYCLTVPKHSVEEAFSAVYQKLAGNEKVYGKEMGRGECRKFPSKVFCLKLPKEFVGEPLTLSLVSGIENVCASAGYVKIFRAIFLSHSTEPFRRGSLLC